MNLVVWVDVAGVAERELAGRLCRRHANALVVPRGWTLDDRRDPVPKLFRVSDDAERDIPEVPAPKKKAASGTKPKRAKALSVDTPSLFETIRRELEPDPDDAPASPAAATDEESDAIDPDETQAIPWSPSLSKTPPADDPDAPRRGRLLGRAFGDPQERQ
ncbi:MAG: hypothetical protein RLZZ526_1667 [Actinomycetota bacterium]